jgi:hypothetical protein
MLVLWGGPNDTCIINFQDESHELESALASGGDFMVECVHNCGHGEPPFEIPGAMSRYAGLWQFAFDHPFWLGAGDSPYRTQGLPSTLPPWCAIGRGSAIPRTGACNPPGC